MALADSKNDSPRKAVVLGYFENADSLPVPNFVTRGSFTIAPGLTNATRPFGACAPG